MSFSSYGSVAVLSRRINHRFSAFIFVFVHINQFVQIYVITWWNAFFLTFNLQRLSVRFAIGKLVLVRPDERQGTLLSRQVCWIGMVLFTWDSIQQGRFAVCQSSEYSLLVMMSGVRPRSWPPFGCCRCTRNLQFVVNMRGDSCFIAPNNLSEMKEPCICRDS